ncbi:iron chelate uptake ABC transporter family permease subunit [Rubellimicrobium aerolatum]|uniref:Iron chelate uptake ABC transporter family permease subunit n=1 Tax=Rubellimicrobium aerolatum TaxID=490979 RepID=A0ABW0SCM7_9RHOB|nr:iron chelate uptake ABC transporter family permease subunit [Rubellimicrobium aerolatum]MBP1806332.1 ABC-type Fe3+-siderophore transport system permease subunit [Rubellimicrobium aerolatum]
MLAVAVGRLATGASGTSLWDALSQMARGKAVMLRERVILWDVRLPRLTLGMPMGANGAVMLGLSRNSLGDPGLVDVGAGLAAISMMGLGGARVRIAGPIILLTPLLAHGLDAFAL